MIEYNPEKIAGIIACDLPYLEHYSIRRDISPPSQKKLAYETIRAGIAEGRYGPGQRLVEQAVAESAGLSRTPVREAIRLLEKEGLVLVEKNRGAAVRCLTIGELRDLYDLRARLEGYACELAAERRSAEQIAALERAIASFDEAVSSARRAGRNLETLHLGNSLFHRTICAAAAHTDLLPMIDKTFDNPLVLWSYRVFTADELDRSNLFHHLIGEAIAAHDGARARRLMIEHVLQARDTLLERPASIGIHPGTPESESGDARARVPGV